MLITHNGTPQDTDATTLHDLVGPLPDGQAVAVNGVVVPRSEHLTTQLCEADVVDVVAAVAGG